jgi:7,8-dihydropterin-6-yl-methyl-4-(beta-D-ribofuranosyl)aminobenzene 5'-phosphate synthase
VSRIDLTVLSDRRPALTGLSPPWGFAALVRTPEGQVLFDSGSDGPVLLKNMAALGIDPGEIGLILLSHAQWDDLGALESILEQGGGQTLAVPQGFPPELLGRLKGRCGRLVTVRSEPVELSPGVYSTGVLRSEPPEQGLAIDIDDGVAAIGGCSHPGLERFVARAATSRRESVPWAVGGFLPAGGDDRAIARSIAALKGLGVESVAITRCTADRAKEALRAAFQGGFVECDAGYTVTLSGGRRPGGGRG